VSGHNSKLGPVRFRVTSSGTTRSARHPLRIFDRIKILDVDGPLVRGTGQVSLTCW
jgi:hypothetical protein